MKHQIKVWKSEEYRQTDPYVWEYFFDMWKGKCICGRTWQFHYWGASLGFGLEHIRRGLADGTFN